MIFTGVQLTQIYLRILDLIDANSCIRLVKALLASNAPITIHLQYGNGNKSVAVYIGSSIDVKWLWVCGKTIIDIYRTCYLPEKLAT